jgi:hypothetical protein
MSSSGDYLAKRLAQIKQIAIYSDDSDIEEYEEDDKNPADSLTRSYHGALQQADLLTQSFYNGQPALIDNADFRTLLENMLEIFNYDQDLADDLMVQLEDLIRTDQNRQRALNGLKDKVIKMFELSRSHGIKWITDKIILSGDLSVNSREVDFFKEIYFAIERMAHMKDPKITSTLALGAELGKAAHRVYLQHRNEKKNEKKSNNVAYLEKDLKRLFFLVAKISDIPKLAFLTFIKQSKSFSPDELKNWALTRVHNMVEFIKKEVATLEAKILKTQEIVTPIAKLDKTFHKPPAEVEKARKSLGTLRQYSEELLKLREKLSTIQRDVESGLKVPKDASASVKKGEESIASREKHEMGMKNVFAALGKQKSFEKEEPVSEPEANQPLAVTEADTGTLQETRRNLLGAINGFPGFSKKAERATANLAGPAHQQDGEAVIANAAALPAPMPNEEEAIQIPTPKKMLMPEVIEMVVAEPPRAVAIPEAEYFKQRLKEAEKRLHLQEQARLQEQQANEELEKNLRIAEEKTRQATEALAQQDRAHQDIVAELQAQLAAQVESARQANEHLAEFERQRVVLSEQLIRERGEKGVLQQQVNDFQQNVVPTLQEQLRLQEEANLQVQQDRLQYEQVQQRLVDDLRQQLDRQTEISRQLGEQHVEVERQRVVLDEQLIQERQERLQYEQDQQRVLADLQQDLATRAQAILDANQLQQQADQARVAVVAANVELQRQNTELRRQLEAMQRPVVNPPAVVPAPIPVPMPIAAPVAIIPVARQEVIAAVLQPGVVERAMPRPVEQQLAQPQRAPAPAPVAFHPANPAAIDVIRPPARVQQAAPMQQAVQQRQAAPVKVTGGSILTDAQKRKR